ncbi:MAG: ABC transporter permease [Ruminococcaceae bacterium]|nr:ABC transporter permease [Oscillospiraceae bacterium]
MNDILFGNNNRPIIKKLSSRCFQQNKSRNCIAALAIFLTTLLICTIFLIGGSYIASWELLQAQTRGTTGHATLNAPSAEQYETLALSEEISSVGLRGDVFLPSLVTADFDVNGSALFYGFRFYNAVEWENHRVPVLENINGAYPQSAGEIMVPTWVLEKWGVTEPYIGMELPFVYQNGSMPEAERKTFRLSGWFDEFDYVGDGNIAYLLVSEMFCDEVGFDLWNAAETKADMRFANTRDVTKTAASIENDLHLRAGQTLSVDPALLDGSNSLSTIAICAALGLGIVLCGYLLIYNVFYISVSNDVRFYGQLRTIGTTSAQIGKIIAWQAVRIACLGIAAGLLGSYALSHFVIPMALRTLTEASTGITVTQRPIIYIGAALFSFVTVLLSIRKPIRIAKKVSPIAALHYQNEASDIRPSLRSRHFSASGMAWRNLQRSRKKSILTVLSIFLGITACLFITLFIRSMDTDNFIGSTMEHDIELINQTLVLGYRGEQEQLFDDDFFRALDQIEGVGSISAQREQTILPEYSEDVFYPYVLDRNQSRGMEAPDSNYYKQYPSRFYTQLVSIGAEKLKEYIVSNGMDYEGFEHGDYGLIATDKPELFPDDMVLRFQRGQISNYEAVADGDLLELPIGGYLPGSYYGGLSSDAPYVFVSDAGMERIAPNAYISRLGIDVDSTNEKQVISNVRELCNQTGAVSLTSKAEQMEGLHSAKITLYTIGGGIAFVLAFIGIINFANIMFTNIESRRHELSVMESIGMTQKQCRRMLQMEGFWYAAISIALCLTIGNILLLSAFKVFKGVVEYAVFSFPFFMLAVLVAVLLAFCWFIPLLFVNRMMKATTVERLRMS